jgi:hypothetical protein
MSVHRIIQESIEKNPLGLKEAFSEELSNRIRLALEAKMNDEDEEDDEDEDEDEDEDDEDDVDESRQKAAKRLKDIDMAARKLAK